MKEVGIIIQARLGSTRLPKKMIKPFFEDLNLLEILLERLTFNFKEKIILATTTNPLDDEIQKISEKYNVLLYRGAENDVLERFVSAAKFAKVNAIIRVCADNPFLDVDFIKKLIDYSYKHEYDYVSYTLDGVIPTIKSHIGIFSEYVTLESLMKVQRLTSDKLYLEHVTNYLYAHPSIFKIKLLDSPQYLYNRNDLRFTLDTFEDFMMLKKLYGFYMKNDACIEKMISFVDSNSEFSKIMKIEILKHKK